MARPIDRRAASKLWRLIGIEVSNPFSNPRQHSGGVIFCGYVDLELSVQGVQLLCLKGTAIKLIDGKVHFDPKGERGKGNRSKEHFPHWLPLTPESRAVFNEKLKCCQEVIDLVDLAVAAITLPKKAGAVSS